MITIIAKLEIGMIGRILIFAFIFLPTGMLFGYFIVTSEDQGPWLLGFLGFILVAAIAGNGYVFFGKKK